MNLKNLFTLAAIVNGLFALAFLIIPEQLTAVYGNTLGNGGLIFARLWSAAILGYAIISWAARNAADSDARQAIVLGSFIYTALGFVVALHSQLTGMANAVGWSTVLLYLLFGLGFGYFQFKKPE